MADTLKKALGISSITVLPFGPNPIKTVAVCSGGADYAIFNEALNLGVDLFLSGEARDVYSTARDAKINVIFAGHHASETVGLKALAQHIQQQFRLETVFCDIPTGL